MQTICAWGVCVYASLQSCDGSEYTLQGPAGGDDITGLSAEPVHYQLLSELGEMPHWVEIAPIFPTQILLNNSKSSKISPLCITGRGFNNLSQVNMARHIPTGQLVAVKQTNLDECTEEELLQLMVSCCPETDVYLKDMWFFSSKFILIN